MEGQSHRIHFLQEENDKLRSANSGYRVRYFRNHNQRLTLQRELNCERAVSNRLRGIFEKL